MNPTQTQSNGYLRCVCGGRAFPLSDIRSFEAGTMIAMTGTGLCPTVDKRNGYLLPVNRPAPAVSLWANVTGTLETSFPPWEK